MKAEQPVTDPMVLRVSPDTTCLISRLKMKTWNRTLDDRGSLGMCMCVECVTVYVHACLCVG